MKKIFGMCALAALALGAPVSAASSSWSGLDTDTPVEVRAEYVWKEAKTVCADAAKLPEGQSPGEYVFAMGKQIGLSRPEQMLMANYCLAYITGKLAGSREINAIYNR